MDIVASNLGLNTDYRASAASPLRLYYGDFAGDNRINLIEALHDAATKAWVPRRDLNSVLPTMPFLAEKFTTHESWSRAAVSEVLGPKLGSAGILEVNTLSSTLFLNRGDRFEPLPLPPAAQFSPAFGSAVADFDGDGFEDVVLSQNLFATNERTPRSDAGRGLLLRGDGAGHFQDVPGQDSGIIAYGEQRGCAAADYDHDGRVDVVLTQNGAGTKLFHNQAARPGLRVRLAGRPGNPHAIGASMRLFFHDRAGPRREVHAGSGYWSQDSADQVLALPEPATELEVRWPGGKTTRVKVPQDAKTLSVRFE
jgi:hypothetical protein